MNIEGAELHLLRDLVSSKMLRHFDLFCGVADDIKKVPELSDHVEEFDNIIKENNMVIHRFTNWKPEQNANMGKLIKNLL